MKQIAYFTIPTSHAGKYLFKFNRKDFRPT